MKNKKIRIIFVSILSIIVAFVIFWANDKTFKGSFEETYNDLMR